MIPIEKATGSTKSVNLVCQRTLGNWKPSRADRFSLEMIQWITHPGRTTVNGDSHRLDTKNIKAATATKPIFAILRLLLGIGNNISTEPWQASHRGRFVAYSAVTLWSMPPSINRWAENRPRFPVERILGAARSAGETHRQALLTDW